MINGYNDEDIFICESCGTADFAECCEGPICPQCGGKMIYTGKNDDEWSALYYNANPNKNDKNTNGIELFEFVSKQFKNAISYDDNLHHESKMKIDQYIAQINAEYKSTSRCPKCGSTDFHSEKRGFSTGRAIAAGALTGFLDVAAVAGAVGKDKMVNVCDRCGHKWK